MGSCTFGTAAAALERVVQFIMGFESTYYWEDPVFSGVIFATTLVTLVSTCYFSSISVIAYTSLALLLSVASIKLYVYVMVSVLKKEVANPVAKYSGMDVTIPQDKVTGLASKSTEKVNRAVAELRRLFFVENIVDSMKFGLSLWLLTYVGSWFNAMTLLILAWIGLFTVPKIYLNNKKKIDPTLELVKSKFDEIFGKFTAMIPQAGNKTVPVETNKKEE